MRISNVDGQVSWFDQDLGRGKTCLAPSPADRRVKRGQTSRRSSRRSCKLKNHTFMLLDLRPGAGNILGPYWDYDPLWLGPPGTLNTSECPKGAVVSSLSRILQATAPSKYYLTRKACLGILRRAEQRGKPLPPQLEQALKIQAGLMPADRLRLEPLAFHINQREESILLGDKAGALMATQNIQMQTFVSAGFCAGAGPSAGSLGYQEEVSPTLKASPGGNMAPSVLCINDQGGKVMDWTEDVAGTLRAQEHGHQPLVFENHGIDGRYTGPHPVAPTMSARYGTGGNNVPLVAGDAVTFSRQRVDVFQENTVASTESARQHKDATDLVWQHCPETPEALAAGDAKEINDQYVSQDKCMVGATLLIRRLTPLECERLQGFPDGWTDLPGASDSARYKALGNSVAIPCVDYLMQGIALVLRAG